MSGQPTKLARSLEEYELSVFLLWRRTVTDRSSRTVKLLDGLCLAFLAAIYPNRNAYHHETALITIRNHVNLLRSREMFGGKALKLLVTIICDIQTFWLAISQPQLLVKHQASHLDALPARRALRRSRVNERSVWCADCKPFLAVRHAFAV